MTRRRDHDRGEPDGHVAVALFALGATAGMLVILIGFQVVPEPVDPGVAEFRALRRFAETHYVEEIAPEDLNERAFTGMLEGLDRHTKYVPPSESEGQRRRTEGDFRGIGISYDVDADGPFVLFPYTRTPAAEAGVRPGDRIRAVDGETLVGVTDRALIREKLAPDGRDEITLRLESLAGEVREVTVAPRILIDPSVRHVRIVPDTPGVGYLAITSFTSNTADEFDLAVTELVERGARALVIDLRFNYGGVLDAAVHIAGRFIESGVVASSEGRISREVHRAESVAARFSQLEVCVLVNGASASASEIVAGALQDHRVAVLVGEPTYGKGVIQTARSFPEYGSRAKVTSGYFYSPSGRNFDRGVDEGREYGILPDVHVRVSAESQHVLARWLDRYDPPRELLDELEAWDATTDRVILPAPPEDPQLDAALALLRGAQPPPAATEAREP